MLKLVSFSAVLLIQWFLGFNPSESLPHEHAQKELLFRIGRSVDKNEIHYFLNRSPNGHFSLSEPIVLSWFNHTNNAYEPMNWIKKTFGYGLDFISINAHEAKFQFVSYKKRIFTLQYSHNGKYSVTTLSENIIINVKSIFVHIDGGSFWVPNVTHIELKGLDAISGDLTTEIIIP